MKWPVSGLIKYEQGEKQMSSIIGIDHGFGIIKTVHTQFKTSVAEYPTEPPIKTEHVVKLGGTYYVCGGERIALRKNKTADETYWHLTLAGIGAEIMSRGLRHTQSVILAAGLPLTQFGREKTPFKNYLLRPGKHYFYYGSNRMCVEIEQVLLYPQGYSAIAGMKELKQEPQVHIVDIGSWTVDALTTDNGIPDLQTARSMEYGVIRCINEITEQIQRSMGKRLTQKQVESLLWGASIMLPDDVKKECFRLAGKYLNDLVGMLYESGFDLASAPVIFLGGGAFLMKRYYPQKEFLAPRYIEDIACNAKGYEVAAANELKKAQRG